MPNQTSQNAVHLNRYFHFTELMRDPSIEGQLVRQQSDYDQSLQTILILKPAGRRSNKLFFFFHGMDGDSGDAVIVRDLVKRLDATVVSLGGRGPAWLSTPFLADAEQVIRDHTPGFQGYYLIGVSMGGTQVLSLGGLLPDDLRRPMLGIVALIPGVDLPAILTGSSNDRVRNTLRNSVDGDISIMRRRSPAQLLDQYKAGLPFVIFYNSEDSLLMAGESETFIANLRRRQHPVTTFPAPGDHNFTYTNFDFKTLVESLGSDSTEEAPPLMSDDDRTGLQTVESGG